MCCVSARIYTHVQREGEAHAMSAATCILRSDWNDGLCEAPGRQDATGRGKSQFLNTTVYYPGYAYGCILIIATRGFGFDVLLV